jgi:hypothetical protein
MPNSHSSSSNPLGYDSHLPAVTCMFRVHDHSPRVIVVTSCLNTQKLDNPLGSKGKKKALSQIFLVEDFIVRILLY